jgi:glutamate synthase domain-containing protein 1
MSTMPAVWGWSPASAAKKSHEIIRKGLEVLINLTHRGAAGCDPETGDGAGILIQIPHVFFARECGELGIQLPEAGAYGVAMVFCLWTSTAACNARVSSSASRRRRA